MQVLNFYHLKDGITEEHQFIGRGSPFGNPFPKNLFRKDRQFAVEAHKLYFLTHLANSSKITKELWLNDKDMVCFCKPKSCHGDIYLEFLSLKEETKGDYKEARKKFLEKYNYVFLPDREGKDHINIYSNSRTRLGYLCSNFSYTPFTHPVFGTFASMEAYWFYVGTGCTHDYLRKLHGFNAKKAGSSIPKVMRVDFAELIQEGIQCKVDQTPELKELLTKNHLPFKHYYVYGKDGDYKCVKEGDGLLEETYAWISLNLGETYKLLIAGSRDYCNISEIFTTIAESGIRISEIVEGGAIGVDLVGYYYGKLHGYPVRTFSVAKEDWEKSRGAGIQRNIEMGDYTDKGIIFIKNNSKGSTHMADYLKKLGKDPVVKHYTN